MNVLLWPFCGQQEKRHNKFRLGTCGSVLPLAYIADQIETELGWRCTAVLPLQKQCLDESPFRCAVAITYVPLKNPDQRIHWNTAELQLLLEGIDLVITNHELLPIPLRILAPKAKIVGICGVKYEPMFQFAFESSDLVVATGSYAAKLFRWRTKTPVSVWETAFDERKFLFHISVERDIDVFFAPRCSVTNYTHHLEFLETLHLLSDLRVVFGDVTGYLQKQRPDLEYITSDQYIQTLFRSKVAVSLQEDWYGGAAIRQACRAGCTPVVLDSSQYDFDAYGCDAEPEDIAAAIRRALCEPKLVDVSGKSFQAAWPGIKADLLRVMQ